MSPGVALPDALRPEWAAPSNVRALMSTRLGGVSQAPFDSLNLRPPALPGGEPDLHDHVLENQWRFAQALQAQPVWLEQVHGVTVARLTRADLAEGRPFIQADAAICTEAGIACTVMVADCLPVLFASRDGQVVGAAHAGWRGLAGGVLEATVAAMCGASGCAAQDLLAWLGPCIGPQHFEVGPDVLTGFGCEPQAGDQRYFRFTPRPDGRPRWHADLTGLARERLRDAGLTDLAGQGGCTVSDPLRFFSFRREGRCGRMAAAIARTA